MTADFVLRAPWYVRERKKFDLRDPRACRPAIQKYGDPSFATRILADPRDSLAFRTEDRWSYPVPITPTNAHGRERFATYKLHVTHLRKLFQPTHDRFYTVVMEVFCNQPGLPRAGRRDDLEVRFVMRRRKATLLGDPGKIRRLARDLIAERAKDRGYTWTKCTSRDSPELYLAEQFWNRQFAEDHGQQLAEVDVKYETEAWMVNADGGLWRPLGAPAPAGELKRHEEEFPMWRLPDNAALCEAGKSRSVWFGVVPTFSAEHWIGPGEKKPVLTKLDDHEIYELVCFVRQPPKPGKEKCPPRICWSAPTRAFRLAAPMDPDGTKNHSVTITTPDLRRLAASAGQQLGPGGARIVTPPGSGLSPPPFADLAKASNKTPEPGGGVCFFAIELFFIVALFLFMLFLPIVVFLFQLWWMLALKFCLPPSIAMQALIQFIADGKDLPDVGANEREAIDKAIPMSGAADLLKNHPEFAQPAGGKSAFVDLVNAMDPDQAAVDPKPPKPASMPADPLCPPAVP